MDLLLNFPLFVIWEQVYDDDDEKFFMQTLREFMRKNNQPLGKLPALGFKKGMTCMTCVMYFVSLEVLCLCMGC